MKLRVLIVEDQTMFLEFLVATLNSISYIQVVGTATSFGDSLLAVERQQPDLAIIDLLLPGGSGLEVARRAKQLVPGMQCLLLTAHPDRVEWNPEMDSSIRTIVDKAHAFGVLHHEIDRLIKETFSRLNTQVLSDPGNILTRRELEIFQLIGKGLPNKQVAADLFISQRTVESHRKAISRKLRSSGADLVRAAAIYNSRPYLTPTGQSV